MGQFVVTLERTVKKTGAIHVSADNPVEAVQKAQAMIDARTATYGLSSPPGDKHWGPVQAVSATACEEL